MSNNPNNPCFHTSAHVEIADGVNIRALELQAPPPPRSRGSASGRIVDAEGEPPSSHRAVAACKANDHENYLSSWSSTSAGHTPGFLLDGSGKVKAVLESTGVPLGMLPSREYETRGDLRLDPGYLLVLTTDGVTEARAGSRRDAAGT